MTKAIKEFRKHAAYLCAICKNDGVWLASSLKLHVDHADGNHNNNDSSNLRYLCPNCHSQTSTYCGRNVKNRTSKKFEDLSGSEIQDAVKTARNINAVMRKLRLNVRNNSIRQKLMTYIAQHNLDLNVERHIKKYERDVMNKLQKSNIDFSRYGWVKDAAAIIGTTPQKASKWLKLRFPDFYAECYTRRIS